MNGPGSNLIVSRIIAYTQQWHLSRSDAFHDLLVEPMLPYAEIETRGWDGQSALGSVQSGQLYVFCQLLPPADWLREAPNQLVWLPMWDAVRSRSQVWWNALPKSLRIVAFSEAVYQNAQQAGLQALRLTYYKNPQDFEPVDWSHGRVLLYWNRTGLMGADFLKRLCESLQVDKLLFRKQIDPDFPQGSAYDLPPQMGRTVVETLPVFQTRQEYLNATRAANLFVAPRLTEGVGMTFLEAMARGCAVFAHDRATMNEYIRSGENGYLFKRKWTISRMVSAVRSTLAQRGVGGFPSFRFALNEREQNWNEIASLEVERLGRVARQQQETGYQQWQEQIPQYLQFLLHS